MTKVRLMTTARGSAAANQFVITGSTVKIDGVRREGTLFQSYDSLIAFIENSTLQVFLDKDNWNYSPTTNNYRSQFLSENLDATRDKLNRGEYTLVKLK